MFCATVLNVTGAQWIDAYPDAKSYVCPGGKKKYPNVKYTQVSAEPSRTKACTHNATTFQAGHFSWHMCAVVTVLSCTILGLVRLLSHDVYCFCMKMLHIKQTADQCQAMCTHLAACRK